MKKLRRRILLLVSVFTMIMLSNNTIINAYALTANNDDNKVNYTMETLIPDDAIGYAGERVNPLLSTIKYSDLDFGVDVDNIDKLTLGTPFFIYSVDNNGKQEPIYYFPVIQNNEIILTLCVFYAEYSWGASLGSDYVSELNKINYVNNNNFIFYEENNNIYAENNNKIILLIEGQQEDEILNNAVQTNYNTLTFNGKKSYIYNTYDTIVRKKTTNNGLEEKGFAIKNSYETRLTTSGYLVSQNSDPICWAASVATTVRYLKNNTSLTARKVCKKIDHSYTGGTIFDKRKALNAYGIYYGNLKQEQASFGQIQTNILDQKPMLLSTYSSNGGHSVTLMGYSTYGGIKQVTIHNPGNNKLQTVEYRSSGTIYSYNGKTWTWKQTLSYH